MSPLLEWRLDSSKTCSNFSGGCIRYPLRALQKHDTDLGLPFKMTLFVHNNAGHFVVIDTASFQLPSRYPPGHAVVVDTDPETNDTRDVDYHFTLNRLCARWAGLRHHENVVLEIGVGNTSIADNVIPFYTTNATQTHCLSHPKLVPGINYFFLLRATCSGGSTISSSNGITIINQTELLNSLDVHVGDRCDNNPKVFDSSYNVSDIFKVTFSTHIALEVGMTYKLRIEGVSVSAISTTINEGTINFHTSGRKGKSNELSVNPHVEHPVFEIKSKKALSSPIVMQISIVKCLSEKYQVFQNSITAYWHNTEQQRLFYKVSLIRDFCDDGRSQSCLDFLTNFVASDKPTSHEFININLRKDHKYLVAVKPCTNVRCLSFALSNVFLLELTPPNGKINTAVLTANDGKICHNLELVWEPFRSEEDMILYRWILTETKTSENAVIHWRNIKPQGNTTFAVSITSL